MARSLLQVNVLMIACLALLATQQEVRSVEARKLMTSVGPTDISNFCNAFISNQDKEYPFWPLFGLPFGDTKIDCQIDVCNILAGTLFEEATGEQVLFPTLSGSYTEESYSGEGGQGRQISVHMEGGGVNAYCFDTKTRIFVIGFSLLQYLSRPNPPVTKDIVLRTFAQATNFKLDFVYNMLDGSKPGDPIDVLGNANFIEAWFQIVDSDPKVPVALVRLDMSFTIQGPIIPGPSFQYPLGETGVLEYHAVQTGTEDPVVSVINFNLLPYDDDAAKTAADLSYLLVPAPTPTKATGTTPPTATPAATTRPPVGTAVPRPILPVGGTCDLTSRYNYQCFSADGSTYSCCPGPCPEGTPGPVPKCYPE